QWLFADPDGHGPDLVQRLCQSPRHSSPCFEWMSVAVFSSLAVDLGCSHRKLRRQRAWLRPFVPAEWQGRYPGRSYWRWPEGGPLKAKEVLCAQTWSILSIKKRSAQTLRAIRSRQGLSGGSRYFTLLVSLRLRPQGQESATDIVPGSG